MNNDFSLLDASDLVFIDAPGTGFGEVITKEKGGAGKPEDFFGIDQDAHAFANFITQFLSDFNRWNSPKYLVKAMARFVRLLFPTFCKARRMLV